MEPVPARTERAAERPPDRPRERDRQPRQRRVQRGKRAARRHAVGPKVGEALEPPQRARRPAPEAAVERAGRKAVPGEQELELGDVPAEGAQRERPAAERVPAVAAERGASPRPGHAVHGQVGAALERAHGSRRRRAGDAVDRPRVETAGAEGDLESRDRRPTGADRRSREGQKQRGDERRTSP